MMATMAAPNDQRYAESGRRVKSARIAQHLIDEATAFSRGAGLNPTIAQAARAALATYDALESEEWWWVEQATATGFQPRRPSPETCALVRERLVTLAEHPAG